MQPELPTSSPENERPSIANERQPETGLSSNSPERSANYSPEQNERRAEAAARVSETYRDAQPAAPPIPTVVAGATATAAADDGTPPTAADEDVIEKEWVDKAKQIISATRDDPAQREREVAKLQADYLRKRYGKHIGATE